MYRKLDKIKIAKFPEFPVKLKFGPDGKQVDTTKEQQAPAQPEVQNAPGQKGWGNMGMSYAMWGKLMSDPNAKEFVTFHTEMSNGSFSFFYNQHAPENGAAYNVRKAQDFVLKFAPGHYRLFESLTNKALGKAKSGEYTRQDDADFTKQYKSFSGAMEIEISGKWAKEKKVKPKDIKE